MLRLAVFVGVFAFSLAAAPRRLTRAAAGGEHQDGEAQVTIVTWFDYEANMVPYFLQAVRSNVEQLEESHDVFYDPRLIDLKAESIDGKYAAVYTIRGIKCEKLDGFISAIKNIKSLTARVIVTCGGETRDF
ncbi:unnamed protein product [Haemonchus placei]|uniref:ACT domain-containing protein n=1 Tax=Haemonchus placei TaxID=6290 RepID=A0A0N4WPZ3_HAEPC|nr:unnamed protein product [Haemonchus placei]